MSMLQRQLKIFWRLFIEGGSEEGKISIKEIVATGVLAVLMLFIINPFSEAKDPVPALSEEIKAQSIEFNKASAVLSPAQKRSIEQLVNQHPSPDSMELTLAVWADQPLPPKGKELTADQKKLANMRSLSIENFVKSTGFEGDLVIFNMAEQAHWLSNMFNSTSTDLKATLAYEKHGGKLGKEKFRVFKSEGKPRKAVLVLAKRS